MNLFDGNSHFVPQFLLKNFSENKKQVWYFRFEKGRKLTPVVLARIRSVFAMEGFYEDSTEKYLSKMESESANIFRKILRNEELYSTEIEVLRNFIFRQFIRSPYAEGDFDRGFTEFYNDDLIPISKKRFLIDAKRILSVDLIDLYILDKPEYDYYDSIRNKMYENAKKRLPEVQKNFGFHGANNANYPFGQELASNFMRDNDAVRTIISKNSCFLITDSPCIQIDNLPIGGLNITLPFILPVSPNHALVLGSSSEMNSLPFFVRINDKMIVQKINEALVGKAKKGVVSHLKHLPQYILEAV